MEAKSLFTGELITTFFKAKSTDLSREIRKILTSDVPDETKEAKIEAITKFFTVKPLEFDFDKTTIKKADSNGDVIPNDAVASRVMFFIPFRGDLDLLTIRPMQSSANSYSAQLSNDKAELIFSLNVLESDGKRIRQHFNNFEKFVKEGVRAQRADIDTHNFSLKSIVSSDRQDILGKFHIQNNLLNDIGFPLRD